MSILMLVKSSDNVCTLACDSLMYLYMNGEVENVIGLPEVDLSTYMKLYSVPNRGEIALDYVPGNYGLDNEQYQILFDHLVVGVHTDLKEFWNKLKSGNMEKSELLDWINCQNFA
jgi:hypothetical protein